MEIQKEAEHILNKFSEVLEQIPEQLGIIRKKKTF